MTAVIAMIAPVSPFRGGVAQHSTMLANALQDVVDLKVFSYRRLYPEFLYPGDFQKDESTQLKMVSPAFFVLDAINPVSWIRAAREIARSRPLAVILPWWTFFLAPCYLVILAVLKRSGISTIFICHNYSDHEAAFWKRWISRLVLRYGDAFLVHSDSIRSDIHDAMPDRPCLVAPMPVYSSYPASSNDLPRRAELELLFFGFVRKYKGLDMLIRSLAALKRKDWHLTVAGECWDDSEGYVQLAKELGVDDRIEFAFRYVMEAEAANYISRADVLVLPYRSATGSAVIPTAYHYNKPVVVTPVGGLPEVVEQGVTGFILREVSVQALTDCLEELKTSDCRELAEGISKWKSENSWEQLASKLVDLIESSNEAE